VAEDPGERVLLVDGNQESLTGLGRRLGRRGYHVALAGNGADALQLSRSQPFDLIVLDITTSGGDGIEFLRRLRGDASTAGLPVIIATPKASGEDLVSALAHGADDYITKPIDLDVLLDRMRAVLRRQAPRLAVAAPISSPALPVPKPQEVPLVLPSKRRVEARAILDGRYRLDQLIGGGSFGAVFRGTQLAEGRTVAIKVLHPDVAESVELRRRFPIEGVASCHVPHPNAVAVYDAGTSDGITPYLVMEYLEGCTLDSLLRQQGTLPLPRCAAIISQVCDVLSYAHARDLVHRDIRPANIFLSQTPQGEVVKVLDFGLAKLLHNKESVEMSGARNLTGNPQFMAPERLTSEPADHRVDKYSVGVTLYLMLAGAMPFGSNEKNIVKQMRKQLTQTPRPIGELVPNLPPAVAQLVMACLARDPAGRPPLQKLQAELNRYRSGVSGTPPASEVAGSSPPATPPGSPLQTTIAPSPLLLERDLPVLSPPSSQALAAASSDDGRPVGR